ncbi:hemerythrin domain-containing protein [Streptomyces sp. NBC_01304]|uniref:hemerythrin domain-containing protein n=1 Tax=Streptomyces sp. NBC_01304 TaxID=2903818 RepID=UPI002E0F4EE6|nr:hemerythrin domain-containing protein [Streptomyces sp. NBC_01304]
MSTNQDVVELILEDHRTMEDLLRLMRSIEADRRAALHHFADLFVAHGVAEASVVYPVLTTHQERESVDADIAAHDVAGHRDGVMVLLALLGIDEIGSYEWDWRLRQLSVVVSRHADEEELTLLNGACRRLSRTQRVDLGAAFVGTRSRLLGSGCGDVSSLRGMVRI